MRVARASGCKEHLNGDDDKDGGHGNQARHSRVAFIPERWQAWISHGNESGGEEVDEGSGYKDTGAEMAGDEKEVMRNRKARKASDDDWE